MSGSRWPHLLAPLRLGALALEHRVVLPALSLGLAEEGRPGGALAGHHLARASPGGLQISAALAVSPWLHHDPGSSGLYCAAQVNPWRDISRALQQQGGLLVAQLGQPLAADMALSPRQLDTALDDYRNAAENAGDAGFDAIELLAAHGALPARLLRDGELALLEELLAMLVGVWGASRIGLCLERGALPVELPLAQLAYLHLAAPWPPPPGSGPRPEAFETPAARPPCPLLVSGGFAPESAERLLAGGLADAVGFGRAFLDRPALVQQLRQSDRSS